MWIDAHAYVDHINDKAIGFDFYIPGLLSTGGLVMYASSIVLPPPPP